MCMPGTVRGQKRVSDLLEWELQVVANHSVMLGIKLRSSVTFVTCALNSWAISLAHIFRSYFQFWCKSWRNAYWVSVICQALMESWIWEGPSFSENNYTANWVVEAPASHHGEELHRKGGRKGLCCSSGAGRNHRPMMFLLWFSIWEIKPRALQC